MSPSGERDATCQQRRDANRTRAFDDQMFRLRQHHNRACEFIFGDGDDVVDESLNQVRT